MRSLISPLFVFCFIHVPLFLLLFLYQNPGPQTQVFRKSILHFMLFPTFFFFPCFNPTFPELTKTASKSSGPITPFLRTINEIQLSEPNLRLLTSNHTTASEKSPWMRFSCFLSNQPYEPLWAIKSAYYLHSPTSCRRVVPLQNLLLLLLNNVDSRSSQPFIH